MLWYKGYARNVDGVTFINEDGVKTFDYNKMAGEPFGNASAPLGSLLINPFDTTEGYLTAPTAFPISTGWTYSTGTVSMTIIGHGLTHPDTFQISGNSFTYTYNDPEPGVPDWTKTGSLDGSYTTASTPTADTLTFTKTILFFNGFVDQYESLGTLTTGDPLPNNYDGYTTNERPTVCGWYAGRSWFTGINHPKLVDRVYFSKLIWTGEADYGKCYQTNDPTDETFNELVADDGGVIVVSDMGIAKGLLDFNGSLLLFTDEGIWEIAGSRGVFTADNYQLRRLADAECTSKFSICRGEGFCAFTGRKGIHLIMPDERTGILYAQNASAVKVQTEWNAIPQAKQERVKAEFDDANKQIWFLYSDDENDTYANEYDRALVFDVRLQAWSKMVFPSAATGYVMGLYPIKGADASEQFKKMKFFVQTTTGTVLSICDMSHDDFTDFDGNEQIPYLIMSYDNVGDWTRNRQAPKIHTYMKKTETGFDAVTLAPVNESSLTMQARWDWTDHTNAGKWSTAQEVYRHVRAYVPSDTSDPFNSGYPVVVTRNKVRGNGRSLHLKFTGAEGYDAHLLGYGVQYKVGNRV
jgi:hypothetical protein